MTPHSGLINCFNPFVLNAPILYPLKSNFSTPFVAIAR